MNQTASASEKREFGRIFIVRHAQSDANAGGRTTGPATVQITETGIRQAQYVADLVSERPVLIAISRYLRTAQTAAPLLLRYPGVPIEEWPSKNSHISILPPPSGQLIANAKTFAIVTGERAIRSGLTALAVSALPASYSGYAGWTKR